MTASPLPDSWIPSILVVDPDRTEREAACRALANTWAELHAFSSPREAMAKLRELARAGQAPFLALCSLRMPEVGGLGFLREARSIDPKAIHALLGADSLDPKEVVAVHKLGIWRVPKRWNPSDLSAMADQAILAFGAASPPEPPERPGPALARALNAADALAALASMSAMVDQLPMGVCMVDASMRIKVFNTAAKTLLGLPESLFSDKLPSFEQLARLNAERGEVPPAEAAEQARRFMRLAMKGEPLRFDHRRPDGSVLDVQGAPTVGGGFVATWTDVTAARVAQPRQPAARDVVEARAS